MGMDEKSTAVRHFHTKPLCSSGTSIYTLLEHHAQRIMFCATSLYFAENMDIVKLLFYQ